MREVEVEVSSWKDTPVSTTVTLMRYWMMTPFCWSSGGGFQVMVAEREVDALPVKPSGLALGTVISNAMMMIMYVAVF